MNRSTGGTRQGIVVVAVAAIAHLSYWNAIPVVTWPDSVRYAVLGRAFFEALATWQWDYWTAPAYPLLIRSVLAFSTSLDGLALVQQMLAVGTCFVLWRAAVLLFGNGPAFAGGLLVALAPARHYYAQNVLTESLAECLLAIGAAALIFAMAGGRRIPAWRAVAGLAFGAAALTRPNLLPAGLVAILVPAWPVGAARRASRALPGMAATAVAFCAVLLPWLAYNQARGVHGITGNIGWQVASFANSREVGAWMNLAGYKQGEGIDGRSDADLFRLTLERFAAHPAQYGSGLVRSALNLLVPARAGGDVAPRISTCDGMTPEEPLPGFDPPAPEEIGTSRCAIHAALWTVWPWLVTAGWIALIVWGTRAAIVRRYDLALLAAVPLSCIASLLVLLQGNTRFSFPLDAMALGLGIPAVLAWFAGRGPAAVGLGDQTDARGDGGGEPDSVDRSD